MCSKTGEVHCGLEFGQGVGGGDCFTRQINQAAGNHLDAFSSQVCKDALCHSEATAQLVSKLTGRLRGFVKLSVQFVGIPSGIFQAVAVHVISCTFHLFER